MSEKRETPFTVKEFHDLAEQRRDEWVAARMAAYSADPLGTYPVYKMERTSDMFYHEGPPVEANGDFIPIELYGMGTWSL